LHCRKVLWAVNLLLQNALIGHAIQPAILD
jgi:hypothetical protein